MNPIKLEDFLDYRFLSAVEYAPDGKAAAFVCASANAAKDGYDCFIYILEDGAVRPLTAAGSERSFMWEDNTHLLFPAARTKQDEQRAKDGEAFTCYYRIDIHGGEARKAFELPFRARKLARIKDSLYFALGEIDAGRPDYYCMSPEERAAAHKEDKENADYQVIDEIPFWANGNTFTNKKRCAVFLVDIATGTCTRITDPLFLARDAVLIGDDLCWCGESFQQMPREYIGFYAYNLVSGETRCLQPEGEYLVYGIHTYGQKLLFVASRCERYGLSQNPWLYLLDPVSGSIDVLWENEEALGSSVGSDCRYGGGKSMVVKGDSIYFTTTRRNASHLWRVDKDGTAAPLVEKEGSIDCFDVAPDGSVLAVCMYDSRLQELYSLKDGAAEQITSFNEGVLSEKYVAQPEKMTILSQGMEIDGWVLHPIDYDPAKTYPALLEIHGGPKTVYGETFFHEMQMFASSGYFVFFCNMMGSDGRGNDFADTRGKYGFVDYENIMDFTDAVLERYPQIDRSRVAVTGGSYGGFMTNWIVGHTDRFVCAATQRSIANWLSSFGTSDIGILFDPDQCAADFYTQPETFWLHSPLKYAANVTTPTLFIHAFEDYRCPLSDAMQFYTAIAARGVPSRMCLFHGENHELSRSGMPKHRVRRLQEISNWISKYTKQEAL